MNRKRLMEIAGLVKEEDKFYDADKEQKHDEEDMPGGYYDDGRPLGESITNMDPKANKLQQAISEAIFRIDENMNYKIFADAVALMLEDGYGSHNFDQFLDHLRMQLNNFQPEQ